MLRNLNKVVDVKSFDDCLVSANNTIKHLMLGNGFSIALLPKIFNYKTLAENIESDKVKKLFKILNNNDFEFVMRRLLESLEIIKHYDSPKLIFNTISNDVEELKKTLVQVIAKCHPPKPSSITNDQYNSCRKFLLNFEKGKIYTFNYDLILYWVLMHFIKDKASKLESDDGFRYSNSDANENEEQSLFWEIGQERKQRLYYIHGAMHIFSDGRNIEKLSYAKTRIPLADQVKQYIDLDRYPVFISEGTSSHKLGRIKKNGYLSRTFSSMKNIKGSIFIFGHSIRDEDDHVFNFMNDNAKIENVFISLYGDISTPDNLAIINKVDKWRGNYPKKNFEFYDALSTKVWNNDCY